jgi:phage terminase large subunit GpA-like protein
VDHIVITGSPGERTPRDALAELLARYWLRANGGAIRIAKACVDAGGRDTAAVHGHLRRLRDPRIAPTKGLIVGIARSRCRGQRRLMRCWMGGNYDLA